MTTSAPALDITGVDFFTLPAPDFEASMHFYGPVLGLPFVKRWGEMCGADYQAGNLPIALIDPAAFGQEPPPPRRPPSCQFTVSPGRLAAEVGWPRP